MDMSPIDMLFDENCSEPIVMFNEKGEEIAFEQIALIPLDETVYVILKPVEIMEGIGEDEGLVFEIAEMDGQETLMLVMDMDVIDAVFEKYDALLDEEGVV